MKKNQDKNAALLKYIKEIAAAKNLEISEVATILAESFRKVYLKEFNSNKIEVKVDLNLGEIVMWRYLEVVTDEFYYDDSETGGQEDNETLVPFSEAQKIAERLGKKIKLKEFLRKPISFEDFDKKTVRDILSIFNQLTTETLNKRICEQWINFKNTVIEGVVEKIDESHNKDIKGAVVTLTNSNGQTTKAYLTRHEFISFVDPKGQRIFEQLFPEKKYLFYIKDVHEFSAGWPVNLSRTHSAIVAHLLKITITEIADGTIEIKNIARIAGDKTKVLVHSNSINIDAIGSCVGPRGRRLKTITDQLNNEKIDIIEWNKNEIRTIINSVIPGKVLGYHILDNDQKEIILITNKENYLPTIGRKGTNVKLASILSGWNIDVKNVDDADAEGIDYEFADNLYAESNLSVSERIFNKHKVSHQAFLREMDTNTYQSPEDDKEDYDHENETNSY